MSDEVMSQEEIEALMGGGAAAESNAASEAAAASETVADADETAEVQAADETPEVQAADETPEVQAVPEAPAAPAIPDIRVSTAPEPSVRPAEFSSLSRTMDSGPRNGIDLLLDVQLTVAVELGRTQLHVRDILGLGPGAVVELEKHSGEPVEVVVNGKLLARGEVVLIDEKFGVRITEIINKAERDAHAKAA
ncbi:MAG: flagellar motor switch protein FliN [Armatimonadetes bacterium]|nr:flagellar motor switch protein FliN [Armatimonadota bacterium]